MGRLDQMGWKQLVTIGRKIHGNKEGNQMTVNVLLSGKLALDGYGNGHPKSDDGTFRLALEEGTTAQDIIASMGVPSHEVTMVRINGCKSQPEADVVAGDRVVLIPADVASLWRYVGLLNLGMSDVCDF
jgi:hypothetical protein